MPRHLDLGEAKMFERGLHRPDTSSANVRMRGATLGLVVLVLVAMSLRFARIGDRSYWYDEGFSWKVITFSWREMVERVAGDTAPPLYYLLLKSWSCVLGDSPSSLRSLSVILGGITVVGMYLFAFEAFREGRPGNSDVDGKSRGIRSGLLVAMLVTFSVFQARWSSEARMYALGTSLAAFSSWLLLRAVRAPEQRVVDWLRYAFVALAFAYTQYYAFFSIAAQGLFVVGYLLVSNRWHPVATVQDLRFKLAVMSVAILVGGYLPWIPGFLNQAGLVREDFWIGPLSWESVAPTFYQMFARSEYESPSPDVAMVSAEVCLALSIALLWRAGPGEWFVFLSAWVPFALSIIVSLCIKPVFLTHYFLFAHLFFLAAIAVLIDRAGGRIAKGLIASGVVLGFAWVYLGYASDGAAFKSKPGARGATEFLDAHRGPGELAIVCSPMLTPSMEGHARNRDGWRTFESRGYTHYHGTAVIRDGEYISARQMSDLASSRIWVVDISRWDKGTLDTPVPGEWTRGGEWRFPEIYGDGCEIIVREYLHRQGRANVDVARPVGG